MVQVFGFKEPDYSMLDQEDGEDNDNIELPAVKSMNRFRRRRRGDSGRCSKIYFPSAKRRRKITSTIDDDLPEDMVYEIFLRLPVKSLIRFCCVSKSVCGMIDSPTFVKNRNHQCEEGIGSVSESDYAIIIGLGGDLWSIQFSDDLKRANSIKLDPSPYPGMKLLGCCNGIFLFQEEAMDTDTNNPLGCTDTETGIRRRGYTDTCNLKDYWYVLLWNPSNGTSKKVECPKTLLPPSKTLMNNIVISFGYDSVNDDYKLIRSEITQHDTNAAKSLQVYSFRKDSWTRFHGKFPPGYPSPSTVRPSYVYGYSPRPGICVSSAMHWLWRNPTDSSRFIAVFDLVSESFRSMTLPENPTRLGMKPIDLTDFGGRLCVTFWPLDDVTPMVWVMENYGIERSWTPLYTYTGKRKRSRSHARVSFSYFPNKERRLLCNKVGLTWWNPVKHSFRKIDVEMHRHGYFYEYFSYIRNLVRLDKKLI